MATIKELNSVDTLADNDFLPVYQRSSSATRKITVSQLTAQMLDAGATGLAELRGEVDTLDQTANARIDLALARIPALSVKDYGAKGNGEADDTAAIQAAINDAVSRKVRLCIPAGRYIVTSPLSCAPTGDGSFAIEGDGEDISIIELNTGGNGLAITLTGNWWLFSTAEKSHGVTIRNLTFSTTNTGTGTGVSITGASLEGRPGAKIMIENVEFRARNAFSQFWSTGLSILDCQDVWISKCRFIIGGPGNTTGRGLFVNGTSQATSPTAVSVDHCEFLYGGVQFQAGDYVEGVYWTQPNNVAGVVGFRWAPVAGESGLHVVGGHINSTQYNIDLDNVFDFEICGALLYRSGTTGNFANIRLQRVGQFAITGNVFKGMDSADGEAGVYVQSSINDEQRGGHIGGNSFHRFASRAIWLGSNACYIDVGPNSFRKCAVRVLNQASVKNNSFTPKMHTGSTLKTLTGGGVSEAVDVTLPAGLFLVKPGAGLLISVGSTDLIGFYDYDSASTSVTNARFLVRRRDGGTISAGTYRFGTAVFEDNIISTF